MHERFAARIATVVARVEEVLLASAVIVIATMTVANVFCRAALGFSLAVTDEVAQISIIVLCFAGLSYAAGKGRHIRMTAVYDQLPASVRKPLMTLITAGTAGLLFLLAFYAMEYVITVRRLGGVSPALSIPYWMVYAICPLGLALAAIQYAMAAARNFVSPGIFISATRQEGSIELLEAKS